MHRVTLPVFYQGFTIFERGHQTVQIFLGVPPLKFDALLDIEWPDTVVPSILLKDDSFVGEGDNMYDESEEISTNLYDESKSATAEALGENIEHSRDNLYLKGVQMQETVTVGGIAIESQAFSSLFAVHDRGWGGGGYYAILGLVPNALTTRGNPYEPVMEKPSVFQTMINRGMLERNVFGFRPATSSEAPGVLHLGWVDASYSDRLVEIPLGGLSHENPWHVSLSGMYVGDQEIKVEDFFVFFTTTTKFLDLPIEAIRALEYSLDIEYGDEIDCEKRITGPPLTFLLGPERKPFVIGPSLYIQENPFKDGTGCYQAFFGATQYHGEGETKHLNLGTGFLEAFYSVFDADRKTISFAAIDA